MASIGFLFAIFVTGKIAGTKLVKREITISKRKARIFGDMIEKATLTEFLKELLMMMATPTVAMLERRKLMGAI